MRKKIIACILMICLIEGAKSQDSCNCRTNLDSMISKVSHNYAGYKDKVTAGTQQAYQHLLDSLRKESAAKKNMQDCFGLLEQYRLYFYDKHLQLRLQGAPPTAITIPAGASKPRTTAWTRKTVIETFEKRKPHALEGIWTTDGYEIAVVQNTATHIFNAIVLTAANKNWKEGMLKFTTVAGKNGFYNTVYYRGDFVKDTVRLNVYKNFMEVENYGSWQKTFPVSADTVSNAAFVNEHSSFGVFQFRFLDAATVYIGLKSCDLSFKPAIDSTLLSNQAKLKKTPNWIIDFRGNQGGSTDVYSSLLPYLYTKPMIDKGSNHWMTPDNTRELKKFVEENRTYLDVSTIKTMTAWTDFGEQHPNEWTPAKMDTAVLDTVFANPQRVAILSDKNNVSSGETFLIVAKGLSDKVTVMGANSGGYLDYGDLLPAVLPCNKLAFYIPARRANYLDDGKSYDRTGYPPDVVIPATTKDWIHFVYTYWKNHPATWKAITGN